MFLARLHEEILPAAFNNEETEYCSCEFDSGGIAEDQFASNIVFVKVTVTKKNEKMEVPVVVKVEPFEQDMRDLVHTDIQFYNEVFMYSQLLPILQNTKTHEPIFAKFHYGVGLLNHSDKNVIILQDLKPLGFRLTESRVFLDYDHLALAMSKLGQFHGLSLAAKQNTQEFFNKASDLVDNLCIKGHKGHEMMKACLHRAIDPLLKKQNQVEGLQKFLTKVDDDFVQLLLEIVSPTDPYAVICHGDFCRNNILFNYCNGKPTDVRFFDLATARYSSPAIDISFFLFMNASSEVRRSHWDDLLEMYHKSLSSIVINAKLPTLEDVKEMLREKAVWGLIHCSYFLPIMLYSGAVDFHNMTPEELVSKISSRGGDDGTKILNELVTEMLQRGMFDL